MLKIVAVATVVAFAIGILVGANSGSDTPVAAGQVLDNAAAASSDVAKLNDSDTRAMSSSEELDAKLDLLQWFQSKITDDNAMHEFLVSEIARLTMIKVELESSANEAVLVP